jgi:hypothetical protein
MFKDIKKAGMPIIPAVLYSLLFAAPRIIRLVHPKLWLEDPFYLYAPYLILKGQIPYRDFGHTQMPGLEAVVALFYGIFGPSILVAEILTQSVVFVCTWLIYYFVKTLVNSKAALYSALIFAFSSLLFRYHILEREIFTLLLTCLMFLLIEKWENLDTKKIFILTSLFILGLLVKLTMVLSFATVMLYLIFFGKEYRNAFKLFVFGSVSVILVFISLYTIFGYKFLLDTLFFHLIKGKLSADFLKSYMMPVNCLDLTLLLGILGIFSGFFRYGILLWLPLIFLALNMLFFYVSPNLWPHNYIDSLLPLSIFGGIFIWKFFHETIAKKKVFAIVSIAAGLFIASVYIVPLRNFNWMLNSVCGFGYLPRKEIITLADYVREHSSKNDKLLIPQYIALEAGRFSVINDRIESAGVFKWMDICLKNEGMKAALRFAKGKTFNEMINVTIDWGWGNICEEIRRNKIKLIIRDIVLGEYFPTDDNFLEQAGYKVVFRTEHYTIWSNS